MNSSTAMAEGPFRGVRCAQSRSVARSVRTCRWRKFDLPMDYEAFVAAGAMVGHGGVVVFDDTVDMAAQARFAMEFCAAESCGKCTPCRVGSVRGVEVIDRISAGEHRDENLALLEDLCDVMTEGSLCAMGGSDPDAGAQRDHPFPRRLLCQGTISPGMQLPISVKTEGKP